MNIPLFQSNNLAIQHLFRLQGFKVSVHIPFSFPQDSSANNIYMCSHIFCIFSLQISFHSIPIHVSKVHVYVSTPIHRSPPFHLAPPQCTRMYKWLRRWETLNPPSVHAPGGESANGPGARLQALGLDTRHYGWQELWLTALCSAVVQ